MKVLVLNSGSSSIKYQFIETTTRQVLARGQVERIGMDDAVLSHVRIDGDTVKFSAEILDHNIAIEYVVAILLSKNHGVIKDKSEIEAVGHRVVHGGEEFSGSVLVTDEVIEKIKENIELAPLHNPHNLRGIIACKRLLPDTPQVAVFDTAFHQKMPEHAFIYGLPYELYKKYKIRRYGFHGTSHRYVSKRASEILGVPIEKLRIITAHLGNGCSMAAVMYGVSVDTTMGFTPLEGLLMGTRSGDIDPAIVLYIMGKEGLSMAEVNALLNKHSGLLGISGVSSDMREIIEEMRNGNPRARLAFDVFCYRIKKYIGAYSAVMGGVDAIVFTAGIGENSPDVRKKICEGLEFLGIKIDDEKNNSPEREKIITTDDSLVKVLVIPTNEELVIALDTAEIVSKVLANTK
ncbi:acetate kinase [Candidatus Thermokryptus mobilis]|uniref:Acetate kinase n=1 Tax=Candidatus Thermokryptus mobilis TaxID=1643428 RepID=A0A0S4N5A8_9BACT|nr:acetate kinase [Candidatus Thermokryptus mobilis]CUU06313.1 acetate kinase [Candidatus Thermokryptus mobilis]